MGAHFRITPAHRGRIEDQIEALIALLDRDDGDPDLEDDDPAGDPLDERGEAQTEDGTELLRTRPLYALDQSLGPINETAALKARARELYGCR